MGRNNWEPEDGMGFAGLVPTLAEKRIWREEDKARRREHQLRADLMAEQERNRELTRQVEQLRAVLEEIRSDGCSPSESLTDLWERTVMRCAAALTAPPSSSEPGRADTAEGPCMVCDDPGPWSDSVCLTCKGVL